MKKDQNPSAHRILKIAAAVFGGLGLVVGILLLANWTNVQANLPDIQSAEARYPGMVGSRIDTCTLCHTSSIPNLNPYGSAYKSNGRSAAALAAIENLDSDGDGFTNVVEINAKFFPGDANDHPVAATPTNTAVPPTATRTNTAVPPTATRTNTPVPPTATSVPPTATAVPPTATRTNTAVPPTATSTSMPYPPPATATPVSATATMQPYPPPETATATVPPAATNTPAPTNTATQPAAPSNTPTHAAPTNTPAATNTKIPTQVSTQQATAKPSATATKKPDITQTVRPRITRTPGASRTPYPTGKPRITRTPGPKPTEIDDETRMPTRTPRPTISGTPQCRPNDDHFNSTNGASTTNDVRGSNPCLPGDDGTSGSKREDFRTALDQFVQSFFNSLANWFK